MVAAPFKAIVKCQDANGGTWNYPITVSDVNDEMYVFPDGENSLVLPSNRGNIIITDFILTAAGTDTSQAKIYVNGKDTGEIIMNAANITTAISRQFMGSPIIIAPGSRVKIIQKT